MKRVLSVTRLELFILKTDPTHLLIAAHGSVPSSGWHSASLEAWRYITPPEDGVQDFGLVALPPVGISVPVARPIYAEIMSAIDLGSYWGPDKPLRGIRVHTEADSLDVPLATAQVVEPQIGSAAEPTGTFSPTFSGKTMHNVPINQLLGKSLRVYHTGDVVIQDFQVNRANIELNSSNLIVDVSIG